MSEVSSAERVPPMSQVDRPILTLSAFFREVESQSFWREAVPVLHLDQPAHRGHERLAAMASPLSRADNDCLRTNGYVRLESVLDPPLAASLAHAIITLRSRNLHPTFVYVYDETWLVLDVLRPYLAQLLGYDLDVLADAWAWHIDPRTDPGGWPIHRGWYEDVRDATGAPSLVNVWIALTDATEHNACIHLVPLSRDPHYPANLHNLNTLEERALALPIRAGSALLWNANAAHWGGACDPSFHQPRISLSFTVRRRGALAPEIPSVHPPLTFQERLDLIADQFEIYGDKELTPDRPEMRWAALVRGMRQAARR